MIGSEDDIDSDKLFGLNDRKIMKLDLPKLMNDHKFSLNHSATYLIWF